MTQQLIALAIFIGIFTLATLRKVHLGVIMFAAAAGVGIWLAGMELSQVIKGFPISILVLLVGVTYFFAIAQNNGTVDRIIDAVIRRVGDRAAFLPLAFFLLTTGIAAMGAPLAGLVMVPIGMPLARKYKIDSVLMGIAIGSGVSAGGFAPTSLFGIVTYGTAHAVNIELNPLLLFSVAFVFNLLLVAVAYALFGGLRLFRRGTVVPESDLRGPDLKDRRPLAGHPFEREALAAAVAPHGSEGGGDRPGGEPGPATQGTTSGASLGATGASVPLGTQTTASAELGAGTRAGHGTQGKQAPSGTGKAVPFTGVQIATIVCMLGLIASVIGLAIAGLEPDIGVLCFAFATVLTLIDPSTGKSSVSKIDWSTVLMVGGIITFVGVLQHMGVVDMLGEAAAHLGSPIVAAFLICLVGGLVSAFASTTGMLAALVPLAIPLVADGGIAGWAVIAALGVCSSVVDLSPFSTVGATVVASVEPEEKPRVTRVLTRWGLSMVVIGPLVLVGGLVVPFSL